MLATLGVLAAVQAAIPDTTAVVTTGLGVSGVVGVTGRLLWRRLDRLDDKLDAHIRDVGDKVSKLNGKVGELRGAFDNHTQERHG